jgi:hypothetical protein
MKLDMNPFPMDMINFEEKKILVRTSQATTTRGKNVIISDEQRSRMLKPRWPEMDVWKANEYRKSQPERRPTSSFLAEKYVRMQQRYGSNGPQKYKRRRAPEGDRRDWPRQDPRSRGHTKGSYAGTDCRGTWAENEVGNRSGGSRQPQRRNNSGRLGTMPGDGRRLGHRGARMHAANSSGEDINQSAAMTHSCLTEQKRRRLMSAAGREIVGPGYSVLPVIHSRVERDQQALKRDDQSSESAQRADCTMAEVGGETSFTETLGSLIPPRASTGEAIGTPESVVRRMPAPRWCPPGLSKTQRRRLQKLWKREIKQGKAETARDAWFNEARSMKLPKKTWREKRLAREEWQ